MEQQKYASFGPVQMLSVAFDGNRFKGEILPELDRLKEEGIVRIIDMLVIRKDRSGGVTKLTASDLDWEEATSYGAHLGTLIGLGAEGEEGAARGAIAGALEMADGHLFDEEDAWRLTQSVPDGMSVGVVLLEHRWALPLFQAIERADGFELANDWLSPTDLVTSGLRQQIEGQATEGDSS
jgi:uncharacterized membrane protein